MIATGRTAAEMTRAVAGTRAQIAFYGSTPAYRAVLDLHGWGGLGDQLNALSRSDRDDKWAAMGALIDDDVLHAFAVVAEPAGVAAQIRHRFGGLIDRVSFYAPYESGRTAVPGTSSLRASSAKPRLRPESVPPRAGRPTSPGTGRHAARARMPVRWVKNP